MTRRLSVVGYHCIHCNHVMGESLICDGCGWTDPLTLSPPDKDTNITLGDVVRDAFYEGYKTNGPYDQDEVDAEWEAYAKSKGFLP